MHPGRSLANQSLYHASLHLAWLERELAAEDLPASVLLEAIGLSIQWHLRAAYGWFLLELAGINETPDKPPACLPAMLPQLPEPERQRGELVELANLEQAPGWLNRLLAEQPRGKPVAAQPDNLAVAEAGWSLAEMRDWYRGLVELIDRMSDSLDEW